MNTYDTLTEPPRWLVMWCLAAALFFSGKVAILLRHRGHGLTPLNRFAFLFLWVGMDAAPWARAGRAANLPALREILIPLARIILGTALVWGVAHRLADPIAQGWCGMVGLILLLHFGTFELLAVFWRWVGIPVVNIMDHPSAATTLADFWGRRWNRAFRDLAHPFLFRPLARRWGQHAGLWLSFLVSGLAHELLISFPAGAGYGLPTLYFLLQALGTVLERRIFPAATSHHPQVRRWLFTHAFTVLPAFILFHPFFVTRVFNPFLDALGALP